MPGMLYVVAFMEIADELRRRIDKKRRELERLESDLRDGQAYLRGLEDTYRLLEGEGEEASLRPGSDLAKTQDILKKAGHPLHINEILASLGKPTDKKSKESLSGSLSAYARDKRVFSKAGPNRFGLLDMPVTQDQKSQESGRTEPPDDFGSVGNITDDDVPF
jgi:hypothetical protein